MKKYICSIVMLYATNTVFATEWHVAPTGDNNNKGTSVEPFRTIQKAADLAQPGDMITVHNGVYRERINPPRGGQADHQRIVYRSAPGEKVEIKGSEIVKGWTPEKNGIWKASLPNSFFGSFNPYNDLVKGDWFDPKGREHHTGSVYLNGEWLIEAANLEELSSSARPLWFATVDEKNTTIWAMFGKSDPNKETVEINVRQTVFYPDTPGRNYITVSGFTMRHAAPPWAPPTAEQKGLIGTHWSKGWVIENNTISHSINAGISLGKYGDEFDNAAPTAKAYNDSIERAMAKGWDKSRIGSHVIRNNSISFCEQAGIIGSMGASFSQITGNHIYNIYTQRRFHGAEMAGIKFHAPIDVLIAGNRIHNAQRGLWLDWMTQGTRVSRNLLYNNDWDDVSLEVVHGPCLIDNNLFLSSIFRGRAQGLSVVHNLFANHYDISLDHRETPYFKPHSTEKAGLAPIAAGDDRLYNNIFIGNGSHEAEPQFADFAKRESPHNPRWVGRGLWVYNSWPCPPQTKGNVYYNGATPFAGEQDFFISKNDLKLGNAVPGLLIEERDGAVYLHLTVDPKAKPKTAMVTTDMLGITKVAKVGFENPDGTPLSVDKDYFENSRSHTPTPGPFENPGTGRIILKIWPVVAK